MTSDTDSEKCHSLQTALDVIGDRWSMVILWSLEESPKRFGEIQKMAEGINTRTLCQRLQKLESCELITKQEYREYPPRTEYAITERGLELKPIFDSIMQWADKHLSER